MSEEEEIETKNTVYNKPKFQTIKSISKVKVNTVMNVIKKEEDKRKSLKNNDVDL